MPVYRTPVFEDASGRAPGLQLRPGYIVKATLPGDDPTLKVEDCDTFFRVTLRQTSRAAGWHPASPVDLRAPMRIHEKPQAPADMKIPPTAKPAVTEPEGAEPAPKPKRSRKKKDD